MVDLSRRGFLAGIGVAGILGTLGIRLPDASPVVDVVPVTPAIAGGPRFDLNSPVLQMWERSMHQAIVERSPLFDPAFGFVGNDGDCLLLEAS